MPAGRPAPCGDENKIRAARPWCRVVVRVRVRRRVRARVRSFAFFFLSTLQIQKWPRAASVSRNRAKVMPPCAAHVCCLWRACRRRLFPPYRRAGGGTTPSPAAAAPWGGRSHAGGAAGGAHDGRHRSRCPPCFLEPESEAIPFMEQVPRGVTLLLQTRVESLGP